MKSKIYEFDMSIYPFPLLVSKDFDYKEIEDLFYCVTGPGECSPFEKDYLKKLPTNIAKTIQVVSKKNEKMYFIVLIYSDEYTIGTIAHESGHISTFLGDWLGFKTRDITCDEPYAYIDEWVANRIYSTLKGKWKEIGGKLYTDK